MSDRAEVKVVPPFVPAAALAIGYALDALWPRDIAQAGVAQGIGATLIAAAVVLALAAVFELRRARTAFDVRKATTHLVRSGVFRFSRNPVYLSMMGLTVGMALVANSLAMLVMSVLAGSALCVLVIRPEERYLSTKFEREYADYASAVRRWI